MNEQHKSKISRIENDFFETVAIKHASQFMKSLKNISDYVQIKYNNDIAEAIRMMEAPDLTTQICHSFFKRDETGREVR